MFLGFLRLGEIMGEELIFLGEFLDLVVLAEEAVEPVGFEEFDLGLVVELDAVEAQLGVQVLCVAHLQLVDRLLELLAEELSLVL